MMRSNKPQNCAGVFLVQSSDWFNFLSLGRSAWAFNFGYQPLVTFQMKRLLTDQSGLLAGFCAATQRCGVGKKIERLT